MKIPPIGLTLLFSLLCSAACWADKVEFLTGATLDGTVTSIDKANREISFEAIIAGRPVTRKYPYSSIHAIEYRGQRYVLTEKPVDSGTGNGEPESQERKSRSRREVERLIDTVGKTLPDWYDETPLEYPKTLDLSWPQPPPTKAWRNQVNVGQYLWDIVHPNPSRWRKGVRLIYFLMERHEANPDIHKRCMNTLAGMYFNCFMDYARAAYWWEKSGVKKGDPPSISLAECYFRLGNKKMAEEMVDSGLLFPGMVKLFGDMGETDQAIRVADAYVRVGGDPRRVYLLAGDAARKAGRLDTAVEYYQKMMSLPASGKPGLERHTRGRARDSIEAIRLFELSDVKNVRDGTYRASSPAYTGPLEVEVQVADGRIESVQVVKHTEKQFFSALTETTKQIVEKQSVKGIDTTSRATITSVAIINATAKALASGAKASGQ